MTLGRYILDGHNPVPCEDTLQWGRWMEKQDRIVGLTTIGDYSVSTVFLGLDHNFGNIRGEIAAIAEGLSAFAYVIQQAILFETMIFYIPALKLERRELETLKDYVIRRGEARRGVRTSRRALYRLSGAILDVG